MMTSVCLHWGKRGIRSCSALGTPLTMVKGSSRLSDDVGGKGGDSFVLCFCCQSLLFFFSSLLTILERKSRIISLQLHKTGGDKREKRGLQPRAVTYAHVRTVMLK